MKICSLIDDLVGMLVLRIFVTGDICPFGLAGGPWGWAVGQLFLGLPQGKDLHYQSKDSSRFEGQHKKRDHENTYRHDKTSHKQF